MASVVFLRGVNVGGHRTFRPGVLARELAAFDAVNVGAAGTFVVRTAVGPTTLRAELLRRLPFEAEVMICPARDVLKLAREEPFPDEPSGAGVGRFVSVLAKRPRTLPPFPICRPAGDDWQVQVVGVSGRFALSLRRPMGPRVVYPNEVVEKNFGVPATTRNWDTVLAICAILQGK
jgi:uncharacterized protein (DUF1697 family)